jgi:exosortase
MSKPSPKLGLGVLCGLSLVLWFRPLLHTIALAFADDRYSHILLVLPVSAALIFQAWKLRSVDFQSSPGGAGFLLLVAVALASWAKWGTFVADSDLPLAISMAGLVVWWIGSLVFGFGVSGLRALLFPALFLFWMVPVPAIVLNGVVALLQQGSAFAAQVLFWVARVPVSREGIILFIPGAEIEVAAECSSIRSSMMLIVTTMVLAQLLLRSPWRKAVVMVAAVPLSIAKNGLRIFTISMLGTRVDYSYFAGRFHHHGGVVFFLIALVGTFLLIWMLRRGERGLHGDRSAHAVNAA